MDIRRTFLWIVFSLSLLLLWDNWQKAHNQPSLVSAMLGEKPPATPAPKTSAETPSASNQNTATPVAPSTNTVATKGETVKLRTDLFNLEFDTIGAQIVRAELLQQGGIDDPSKPMVLLDRSANRTYIVQSGLTGGNNQGALPNHQTPYRLVSSESNQQNGTHQVVFEAQSGDTRVTKTYLFKRDSYVIDVTTTVANLGTQTLNPSLYLQITRDGGVPEGDSFFYQTFTGPALFTQEGKFQKVKFDDITAKKAEYVKAANDGWLGFVQHYFASAWIPQGGAKRHYDMVNLGDNLFAIRAVQELGSIEPNKQINVSSQLWLGPQDQKAMAEVAEGLDLVVDYGIFSLIAKPLFKLMTWIHELVNNWGWTIVILTVLIKLLFFPLSAASYRSMAKMKKVTPRLTALREQYGNDKVKLNQAMMELYRTEKINPLGGCLPMLVQIPVFISLYWVLLASVEMRGAPWILWITDLSARDPYFILPVIMMATMFLQMKLNPTPPDPMQARIMMIMPIVFGGMMFFFPAGLVLYWVVNNILSIAQQWTIGKSIAKAEEKAANS